MHDFGERSRERATPRGSPEQAGNRTSRKWGRGNRRRPARRAERASWARGARREQYGGAEVGTRDEGRGARGEGRGTRDEKERARITLRAVLVPRLSPLASLARLAFRLADLLFVDQAQLAITQQAVIDRLRRDAERARGLAFVVAVVGERL